MASLACRTLLRINVRNCGAVINKGVVSPARHLTVSPGVYFPPTTKKDPKKISTQEWQSQLTPEQFHVAREGATEPPFSGAYNNHYAAGMYQCVCCGSNLFSSKTKFDSGSGWPSFHTAEGDPEGGAATSAIEARVDRSHHMVRTEVVCRQCEAHLGHVFPDGPEPTGLRYCVNSASLKFLPKKVK